MGLFNFKRKEKKSSELTKADAVEVRKAQQESLDRLNNAFSQLVDRLENINGSLDRHIEQQQELLKSFESVPELTSQQTELIEQTLDKLGEQAVSTKEFTEIVSKIPDEAVRQTRELEQIKNDVAEGAGFEKSLCQEFIKLNIMFKRQLRLFYWSVGFVVVLFAAVLAFFLL